MKIETKLIKRRALVMHLLLKVMVALLCCLVIPHYSIAAEKKKNKTTQKQTPKKEEVVAEKNYLIENKTVKQISFKTTYELRSLSNNTHINIHTVPVGYPVNLSFYESGIAYEVSNHNATFTVFDDKRDSNLCVLRIAMYNKDGRDFQQKDIVFDKRFKTSNNASYFYGSLFSDFEIHPNSFYAEDRNRLLQKNEGRFRWLKDGTLLDNSNDEFDQWYITNNKNGSYKLFSYLETDDNKDIRHYRSYDSSSYYSSIAGDYLEKWNGKAWINIMNGLPIHINTIVINPNDSDEIYAATNSGLYKTSDGGFSWRQLGFTEPVNQIIIGEIDQKVSSIYLVASGKPYLSQDSGKTWKNITTNLPTITLKGQGRTATVVPAHVSRLILVDSWETPFLLSFVEQFGIYKSNDNGKTWVKFSNGYDINDGAYAVYQDEEELAIGAYGGIYVLKPNSDTFKKLWSHNTSGLGPIKGLQKISESDYLFVSNDDKLIHYSATKDKLLSRNFGLLPNSIIKNVSGSVIDNKYRLFVSLQNKDNDVDKNGGLYYSDNFGLSWAKSNCIECRSTKPVEMFFSVSSEVLAKRSSIILEQTVLKIFPSIFYGRLSFFG